MTRFRINALFKMTYLIYTLTSNNFKNVKLFRKFPSFRAPNNPKSLTHKSETDTNVYYVAKVRVFIYKIIGNFFVPV